MYWQEDEQNTDKAVPDDVIDVVFSIQCRSLPVEHAYALSQCVQDALPWFIKEPLAGMHMIHVAESANGWMRPDGPDQVLHPSRRSKFVLRIPKARLSATQELIGKEFIVDDHSLKITKAITRKLTSITTLFSRYVVSTDPETESEFIDRTVEELKTLGVVPKKLLCGILRRLRTPKSDVLTRSLLLADLSRDETILLQERGLGEHRVMGCGLFLPHKDVNQISEDLG